jgi:hypothetical protein
MPMANVNLMAVKSRTVDEASGRRITRIAHNTIVIDYAALNLRSSEYP